MTNKNSIFRCFIALVTTTFFAFPLSHFSTCAHGQNSRDTGKDGSRISSLGHTTSLVPNTERKIHEGSAGHALNSLFDVMRAPPAKSMGLLQGNFLDAVKSDGALQVALVIDNTESMTDQLASIRKNLPNMLGDLKQLLDGNVEFAIVVYADAGNQTNGVTGLTQNFVSDLSQVESIVSQLQPESGAPYFHESVDIGIHHAIHQLQWSQRADVAKWVMVFGDAPPYDSGFEDSKTEARRVYESEVLIDTANQKDISIHCLLCNSRDKEKQAFEKVLDKTRKFMNQISSETGGLMLDLSYADVRQKLAENASRIRAESVRIGHITQEEIEQVKARYQTATIGNEKLKVAILPMMPLDRISFFHERPEVQLTTELRQLFKLAPGIRTVNPRHVEEEIMRLQSEGIPSEQWGQALCYRLRADIVLTGRMDVTGGQARIRVQPFARNSKQELNTIIVNSNKEELAKQFLGQLGETVSQSAAFAQLAARMKQVSKDQNIDRSNAGILWNLNDSDKARLLSGFEALEQALGYSLGDPNGKSLLDVAETNLKSFLKSHPKQPFVHAMLASCQFNQARALESMGILDQVNPKYKESTDSIKQAYLLKNEILDSLTKLEIEGDYNLMVRQKYDQAVEKYEEILNHADASPLNRSLRAHWMIAGILAGDWQAGKTDSSVVDLEKSRQHLITILALWPESVEARKIRKHLHWDGRKEKSRTPFFPKEADVLVVAH